MRGSSLGVNQFSLTDAVVYNNPTTVEPNQSTVSSVRQAYQSQILGNLGLPNSYDTSVDNSVPGILRDLWNGRAFKVGNEAYPVKAGYNYEIGLIQIWPTMTENQLKDALKDDQKNLTATATDNGRNMF